MLLFLDFDGVLRPTTGPAGVLHPGCLEGLRALLDEFPRVRLVITSDWRLGMSLDDLKEYLLPSIAERVVGQTPALDCRGRNARYQEVVEYVRSRRTPVSWAALDDDPYHYPEESVGVTLVLTDPAVGFNAIAAEKLRRLLSWDDASSAERHLRILIENGAGWDF